MNIFDLTNEDLVCAQDELLKVDVGDSAPISQRAYCRSPKENNVIGNEVRKLLLDGFFIPANHYDSLILSWSERKDGTNRVVIDYRKLNTLTIKYK